MKKIVFLFAMLYSALSFGQNTCATAVPISSIPFNSGPQTTCGTVDDYAAGTLFNVNYGGGEDYVYSIVISNAPVTYNLALGGTATWKIASVHSACPPTNGNAIGGIVTGTNSTGTANVTFPTNGTYFIFIDTWPAPACGAFTLSVTVPPPAPPCTTNISPANAATGVVYQPATQLTWNSVASATAYDVYYSSNNGTSYSLLGQTNVTTIGVTGNAPNTVYFWYIAPVTGPTAATTCLSRATSFTTGSAAPAPANDNCSAAVVLTASSTTACGATVAGTTVSATASAGVPAPSCSATGINDDVWYRFVATATAHKITISNTSTSTAAAVYSGVDCNTLTQLTGACATGGPAVSGLTIGTTYYVRVYTTASTATTFTNFDICIGLPPLPPANDDCANAIALSPFSGPTSGTTVGATQTMAAELCGGFTGTANDDVWYKFTALQAGSATFTLTSPAIDAVIIAYSGTCGTLTNISCADNGGFGGGEVLTLPGLTAGTTYFMRVYGYGPIGTEGIFTITSSGTALPVSFVDFRGERKAAANALAWTTQSEQNSAGFELQRSAGGSIFSSIGYVASKAAGGNSNGIINYAYSDVKPFAGSNYYRLKQLDKDGRFTYSSIVIIKGAKSTKVELTAIYPNPALDVLRLMIAAPANQKVTIVITDITGKMVMQQAQQVVAGDNNVSLNVDQLSKGSYLVKVMCADGCESVVSKFMKQ